MSQIQASTPTEITVSEAACYGESGTGFETLNLGHACLRNECCSRVRFRRPRRSRTPLHRLRPSGGAEARFTPDNYEFRTK
jgi:hypothetical protein